MPSVSSVRRAGRWARSTRRMISSFSEADWSKLPHFPAPKSSGKGETKWVNPETYFDELPAVMKSVPPLPFRVRRHVSEVPIPEVGSASYGHHGSPTIGQEKV